MAAAAAASSSSSSAIVDAAWTPDDHEVAMRVKDAVAGETSSTPTARIRDIDDFFHMSGVLGRGSFAVVWKAIDKFTKKVYAVKVLDKMANPKEVPFFFVECRLMALVRDHPNIVGLRRLYETATHVYAIIDYCEGGNLLEKTLKHGTRSETETAFIIRDIASALVHIHRCGVVHRDIKLENIMCATSAAAYPVMIADFGLAKMFRHTDEATDQDVTRMLHSACGSPMYVAPEVINRKPYTTSIDVWGMGIIAYSLLSGMNPFYVDGIGNTELYRRIQRGDYNFHGARWDGKSRATMKFVCRMMTIQPKMRISAANVLTHRWMASMVGAANSIHMSYSNSDEVVSPTSISVTRRIDDSDYKHADSEARSTRQSHSKNDLLRMSSIRKSSDGPDTSDSNLSSSVQMPSRRVSGPLSL